ncbi:MAG: hypothetical protein AAB316_20800, partial [Bacteroidota bacterium]
MLISAARKPATVLLISPHKNEHPAALPFQARLASRFESKGYPVLADQIDELVDQAAGARQKLLQKRGDPLSSCLSDGFAQVLRMEDLMRRFEKMDAIAKNCPEGTLVLEIHSSSRRSLGREPARRMRDFDDDFFDSPPENPFWRISTKGSIKIGNLKTIVEPVPSAVI